MKLAKLRLALIIFFIIILGVLSLPNFSVEIQGEEVNYEGIRLDALGIDTELGSFVRSTGLFPSTKVVTQIDFPENLSEAEKRQLQNEIYETIEKRVTALNFYNIEIRKAYSEDEFFIEFDVPNHYQNIEETVNLIVAEGEIGFTAFGSPYTVEDTDVIGITISYESNYGGDIFIMNFNSAAQEQLRTLFAGGQTNVIVTVDGEEKLVLVPFSNEGDSRVRAIPLEQFGTEREKLNYLRIVRSYFVDDPLEFNIEITRQENIAPSYSVEGGTLIGILFVAASILLCVVIASRKSFKHAIFFGLMFSFSTLLTLVLIKTVSAYLSIGTIWGVAATIIFFTAIIVTLLNISDWKEVNMFLTNLRNFSIFLFLLLVFLIRISLDLGIINDVLGVFLGASFAMLVMSLYGFREVMMLYFNQDDLKIKQK